MLTLSLTLDAPAQVDALGRTAYARHLLQVLMAVNADSGGVIGIEAPWGSGKTSILQSLPRLAEEIEEARRPIFITFNPWMLSGTDNLVTGMLGQFAATLRESDPNLKSEKRAEIASAILHYASALKAATYVAPYANAALPGSGVVLGLIGKLGANAAKVSEYRSKKANEKTKSDPPSLIKSKRKVEDLLKQSNRSIIFIIDDIDRLPPKEIAEIIQAVKAVADFPQVIYLLSYDEISVSAALEKALSVTNGRKYLEKIIQIPLRLPPPPIRKFVSYANNRLNELFLAPMATEEKADLGKVIPYVIACATHPRNIERLRTKLTVSLAVLRGIINIADVVALEAIDLFFPSVMVWLKKNTWLVTSVGVQQYDTNFGFLGDSARRVLEIGLDEATRKTQREAALAQWKTAVPEEDMHPPLGALLQFLFDSMQGGIRIERSKFKRVNIFRFWYRWQCYYDFHESMESPEIQYLLNNPEELIDRKIHTNTEIFLEFCLNVVDLGTDNLISADASKFADVYRRAEEIVGTQTLLTYSMGYGPASAFEIILELDAANKYVALEKLVQGCSVWLAEYIFVRAYVRAKESNDHTDMTALLPAALQLNEKVSKAFSERVRPPDELSFYSLAMGLYHRGQSDLARKLTENYLVDSNSLLSFFHGFEDSPEYESFPMEVKWSILPHSGHLRLLMEGSQQFQKDFSTLFEKTKVQSTREAEYDNMMSDQPDDNPA